MADIITSSIEISSGVISSGLSIGMDGEATVLSGGTVTDAAAFETGYFWLEQGAYVSNVSLSDYGELFIDGGRAENVTMETGGQADVYEGVLQSGTLLDGGVGIVFEAGSALNLAVSSGGSFLVYGGFTADTVITDGGYFVIQTAGGQANDTIVSTGGHARVVSGAKGSRSVLKGGRMDMLLGYLYDTTVSAGGRLEIMSGQAFDTDILEGGSMAVSRSADAHRAVLKGGILNVHSGVLYDAEISAGAAVMEEALAVRMNMAGGSVQALSGTIIREGALNGGTLTLASGTVVSGANFNGVTLEAEAGAAVCNGVVNADLSVTDGVTFSGTTVNSCTMSVQAGAIVAATTVSDGGTLSVLNAANVSDTTVRAGGLLVLENGTAQGVLVSGFSSGSSDSPIIFYPVGGEVADGGEVVAVGGSDGDDPDPTPSEEEISSAPARMLVSSGGIATNVVVSCGTVNVSGGLVSGLTMDKGEIVIGSGGVVRGAVLKGVLSRGGIFIINDLIISVDPTDYLLTRGGVSYSGVPFLTGDGMSYLTVEGGAGGATAGEVVVGDVVFPDGPGTIILYPTTPFYINPNPTEGFLTVESGGLLEDAEASAMQITVSGGGVVRNLSATDYTKVTLESGGTLTGRMSFASGASVIATEGGIVDFDLSALAPGNQVLLTGTGNIQGAPLYTITVSADQAAGRYMLADGASAFTGTLTVRNTDWVALGTLTVGELTEIDGRYYLARTKNNYLSLQIWTEEPTVLPDPETVYLNTTWSELDYGTVVTLSGGGTATVGYDAFAEMDAASEAVAENGTIVITGCDATISGAVKWNVEVAAGASVTGYTVASQGRLTLKSGASARDVAVSGGTLTVEEGATLTVTQPFFPSGTLTVNGTFNFDISGSAGGTQAYLNNISISALNGAPTFTLTVGDGQANAAYRLCSLNITDNKDFVLTIVDGTGAELGTVALRYTQKDDGSYQENRTDAVIDGKRYSLRNISSGSGSEKGVFLTVSNATDKPSYVYVDASWSGKSAGDTISVRNPDTNLMDSVTFGIDAFATLEEAVAAGDADCTITIGGGTFSPADGLVRNTFLNDGVIENTTVSRSLTVNGGMVTGLTVAAGGSLTVNGGTVSGGTFEEGSSITVKSGTFLFDVTGLQPGGAALYGGLTYVSGTPNCTITVLADQADGVYTLGVNAAGFAPSFAIRVKSEQSTQQVATLAVGETYRKDGFFYAIAETDGALTLTVGSYEIFTTVYANTAWDGYSYGDSVTLGDGGTATFGANAFATLRDAYGVVHTQGTVYLDGGTFSLADMNVENTRKTVARAGSVVTGEQPNSNKRNIDLTLESGATADTFDFRAGTLTVNAGALLVGEIQTGYDSSLVLHDGAILTGTLTANGLVTMRDVSSLGGTLVIVYGGTLGGTATFTSDMDITVNGVIDFDISESTAGDPALFRGLSYVKAASASYFIEVSNTQARGVYTLAEYASRFTGYIRVRNEDGQILGNITVGESFISNGSSYTLTGEFVDDSYILSLAVEELPPLEYVYVNSSAWKSTTPYGTVVAVPGGTAIIGYDAFSNLANAFRVLNNYGSGSICITGGTSYLREGIYDTSKTYSQDIVVSGAKLIVYGSDRTSRYTGCISVIRNGALEITGADAANASIVVDETATLTLSSKYGTSFNAVSLTVEGRLIFDLTDQRYQNVAVINDLSGILGGPNSYAIRLTTGLENTGDYLIATGATGIGPQIDLLLGTSMVPRTLIVNGPGSVYSGKVYQAVLTENNDLVLRVDTPKLLYVNEDFTWSANPDTMATNYLVYPISGGTAIYGGDAFPDINSAFNIVASGSTVILEKGNMNLYNKKYQEKPLDFNLSILEQVNLTLNFTLEVGPGCRIQSSGAGINGALVLFSNSSLSLDDGSRYSGSVTVSAGATLTVNAESSFVGSVTVDAGGSLTVAAGASLTVAAGASLSASVAFAEGSGITVDGELRFSIADLSAGVCELGSGLSSFSGTGTCVISIGKYQEAGQYTLFARSGSFAGTITIENSVGDAIGSLSLGETLRIGKRVYTLSADDSDNLDLTISFLDKSGVVHLDSGWDDRKEGEWFELATGEEVCFGYDAFSAASDAFEEIAEGGSLVILGGTHSRSGDLGNAVSATVRGGEFSLNGTLGEGLTITVSAGGTLSGDLTVSAGATITVEAGGSLTAGHITVEAGASVTVEAGASVTVGGVVNFRLLGVNPDNGPMFRGLSFVQGAPSFTLTIDQKDMGGIFVLAEGVGQFDGVITVQDSSGTELGTLSVGESLVYDHAMYILTNSDAGDLNLIVTRPNRVNVNSDWAGLEDGATVVLKSGLTATIGYDAFADVNEASSRVSQSGAVIIEKGQLSSLGANAGCRNLIVVGDVSVDSCCVESGVTITVGADGKLSGFITVNAGGAITVEAGGTLSVANYNFMEGSSITVNGILDFDVTNVPYVAPGDKNGVLSAGRYCFGFEYVRGNATYTITVDNEKMTEDGKQKLYAISDKSGIWNLAFTVVDVSGETLGTLTASDVVVCDDYYYRLKLVGLGANNGFWFLPTPPPAVSPYVSSEWEGLVDGSVVYVQLGDDTVSAVIGKDAFSTYAAASEVARATNGFVQIAGYVETDKVDCVTRVLPGGRLSCSGVTAEKRIIVFGGGILENVIIDDAGESMDQMIQVGSGGDSVGYTIRNFTLRGTGVNTMNLNYVGRLTGYITFETTMTGSQPPVIDFDLSMAVDSRALVENLYYALHSCFLVMPTSDKDKDPSFTITVEDVPAAGTRTYKLATNASDFNKTITVMNRVGNNLGTLTVGGSITVNEVVYSLYLAGGNLMLQSVSSISDTTPPTISVSASPAAPTNQDVTVTALVEDDGQVVSVYYRIGEDDKWKLCDGTVTVSENAVVYFKATDAAGNESEAVSFTVDNIDKVAPDAPANLRAEVVDRKVTLSWDAATDDFSGVAGYEVKYWNGEQEFTVNTTETSIELKGVDPAEWSWSVRTLDAAGNASEASENGEFTVLKKQFFTGDFDGEGKSSFAMVSGSAVTVFDANGQAFGAFTLDDGWNIAGAGDFDGDGMTDLIRVNAEGLVIGEFSNGDGTFVPRVLNLKGEGWDILGIGDFDGDGADDVLIANPTGASETVGLIGYWKGGTEWTLLNGYSAEWEMVATGDFDADGKCDTLWRNSFTDEAGRIYNAYCTWITDPAPGDADWRMVSVAAPDEWDFLCSGDFDADGMADVAMINAEGVVGIWGVKNGWLDSWSILSAVNTAEWTLVGVGDYDGNGTDDIAWRNNDSGLVGCWQIEDKQLASWMTLAKLA